jgi:hypothetical protein
MRRTLLLGAFAAIFALTVGCQPDNNQKIRTNTFVYNNHTNFLVKIQSLAGGQIKETWPAMYPGGSMVQIYDYDKPENERHAIAAYPETNVIFEKMPEGSGEMKILRFRHTELDAPFNLHNLDNYRGSITLSDIKYEFEFTPEMVEAATPYTPPATPDPAAGL